MADRSKLGRAKYPYLDFALELQRAQKSAGFESAEHLAKAEGINFGSRAVRRYLSGERLPPLAQMRAWEKACGAEEGSLSRHHPDFDGPRPTTSPLDVQSGRSPAPPATSGQLDARRKAPPWLAGRAGKRRPAWQLAGLALALVALLVAIASFRNRGSDSSADKSKPSASQALTARAARLRPTYQVRAGGPARTWSDYTIAGGKAGPEVIKASKIMVSCRTDGLVVDDGDRWWYLVASRPWSKRFWVTADAFYNKPGLDTGPLKGTAFFDPRVPVCP